LGTNGQSIIYTKRDILNRKLSREDQILTIREGVSVVGADVDGDTVGGLWK
jgi:hypothetical protein